MAFIFFFGFLTIFKFSTSIGPYNFFTKKKENSRSDQLFQYVANKIKIKKMKRKDAKTRRRKILWVGCGDDWWAYNVLGSSFQAYMFFGWARMMHSHVLKWPSLTIRRSCYIIYSFDSTFFSRYFRFGMVKKLFLFLLLRLVPGS